MTAVQNCWCAFVYLVRICCATAEKQLDLKTADFKKANC